MAALNVVDDVRPNSLVEIWGILRDLQRSQAAYPDIVDAVQLLCGSGGKNSMKSDMDPKTTAPGLLGALFHPELAQALDEAFELHIWHDMGVRIPRMGFWRRIGLKNRQGVSTCYQCIECYVLTNV